MVNTKNYFIKYSIDKMNNPLGNQTCRCITCELMFPPFNPNHLSNITQEELDRFKTYEKTLIELYGSCIKRIHCITTFMNNYLELKPDSPEYKIVDGVASQKHEKWEQEDIFVMDSDNTDEIPTNDEDEDEDDIVFEDRICMNCGNEFKYNVGKLLCDNCYELAYERNKIKYDPNKYNHFVCSECDKEKNDNGYFQCEECREKGRQDVRRREQEEFQKQVDNDTKYAKIIQCSICNKDMYFNFINNRCRDCLLKYNYNQEVKLMDELSNTISIDADCAETRGE